MSRPSSIPLPPDGSINLVMFESGLFLSNLRKEIVFFINRLRNQVIRTINLNHQTNCLISRLREQI